jgi:hypothetical protein
MPPSNTAVSGTYRRNSKSSNYEGKRKSTNTSTLSSNFCKVCISSSIESSRILLIDSTDRSPLSIPYHGQPFHSPQSHQRQQQVYLRHNPTSLISMAIHLIWSPRSLHIRLWHVYKLETGLEIRMIRVIVSGRGELGSWQGSGLGVEGQC